MFSRPHQNRISLSHRILSAFIAVTFISSTIVPPQPVWAQTVPQTILNLPVPGAMVGVTNGFTPALIRGVTIHPENPLKFDFIVSPGDSGLSGPALNEEATKLIKYFLAALTVPEEDLWVNLSPYEKDRVIPEGFGDTEMGRDLLSQDYILKQLTASLMYPEDELGRRFWDRVHKKAYEQFGTTDILTNTFNKIWIVPEKAVVYEHDANAFVVENKLKVMLEEDFAALKKDLQVNRHSEPEGRRISNRGDPSYSLSSKKFSGEMSTALVSSKIKRKTSAASPQDDASRHIETDILREVLIPEITREVNEGETFANLRQIFQSMILAAWYKQALKDSLLGQVYVNQNKTLGVDTQDKEINQKIYGQYLTAFQKGVYNYIKEDIDPATQQTIPRKYFSGGFAFGGSATTGLGAGGSSPVQIIKIPTPEVYGQLGATGTDGTTLFTTLATEVNRDRPETNLRLVNLQGEQIEHVAPQEEEPKIISFAAARKAAASPVTKSDEAGLAETAAPAASSPAHQSKDAKQLLAAIAKKANDNAIEASRMILEGLLPRMGYYHELTDKEDSVQKIFAGADKYLMDHWQSGNSKLMVQWFYTHEAAKAFNTYKENPDKDAFFADLCRLTNDMYANMVFFATHDWITQMDQDVIALRQMDPSESPSNVSQKIDVLKEALADQNDGDAYKRLRAYWTKYESFQRKKRASAQASDDADLSGMMTEKIEQAHRDISDFVDTPVKKLVSALPDNTQQMLTSLVELNETAIAIGYLLDTGRINTSESYADGTAIHQNILTEVGNQKLTLRQIKQKLDDKKQQLYEKLEAERPLTVAPADGERKKSAYTIMLEIMPEALEGEVETPAPSESNESKKKSSSPLTDTRPPASSPVRAIKGPKDFQDAYVILERFHMAKNSQIDGLAKKDLHKLKAMEYSAGDDSYLFYWLSPSRPIAKFYFRQSDRETITSGEILTKKPFGFEDDGSLILPAPPDIINDSFEFHTPGIRLMEKHGALWAEPIDETEMKRIGTALAAASSPVTRTAEGGINLNPKLYDLQIKRDGNGVPLPVSQQPIADMHIDGFVPIIIHAAPVSIPLLLGLVEEDGAPEGGSRDISFIPELSPFVHENRYAADGPEPWGAG